MSGKKENVQSSGITRRDFVKGLAIGAAGLGIATILPGGIITAASAADTTTKILKLYFIKKSELIVFHSDCLL